MKSERRELFSLVGEAVRAWIYSGFGRRSTLVAVLLLGVGRLDPLEIPELFFEFLPFALLLRDEGILPFFPFRPALPLPFPFPFLPLPLPCAGSGAP